ncbi:unnamed protein product [Rhizophagus irregularis]|uniref:MULE transposase domain-containing protein n=1 Tax=Rhizophagus irregularis TaxID=588596 RepID=A0A915Z383_9GLOM|nr:protein FAR1-RELATED SEQUENCE 5-like [Rhizophagus irregularis DAOM 181602=DAOM 197198]CAB5360567.1 unnamed protein product [Rhizophagus irregularis]
MQFKKIKQEKGLNNLGDAAFLLMRLFELQADAMTLHTCKIPPLIFITDANPAMIAAISTVFSETYHMQCLYHLYQNLLKKLCSYLGSPLYQEFLKNFRAI